MRVWRQSDTREEMARHDYTSTVELWKHILDRPALLGIDRSLLGWSHAAGERREAERTHDASG